MHLFFNMIGVYMFGTILENLWGPKRFLNFYLLCGLGAAAAQYIMFYLRDQKLTEHFNQLYPGNAEEAMQLVYNHMICLGASGSLFGLLVAFAMMFPNTYLNIYFVIPVKAKYFVTGYVLFELYYGFMNQPGDKVAHFAHLGGLIMGVIIMLIWKRSRSNFY
jgi:membrane associated rhomboid family serine protease